MKNIVDKLFIFVSAVFIVFIFFPIPPLYVQAEEIVTDLETEQDLVNFNEITLAIEDKERVIQTEKIKQWVVIEPVLRKTNVYIAEIENIHYCPISKLICDFTNSEKEKIHRIKKMRVLIRKREINDYFNALNDEFKRDPVAAKFQVVDGRVSAFVASQDGVEVDAEKNANLIIERLLDKSVSTNEEDEKMEIVLKTTPSPISTENANSLGIATLIGEGKSNFKGSTNSRIHNIKVAINQFHGLLIAPGEEFSFVNNLGEVDGKNGYLPELVIKRNKTEPEFGGGICQVSTTVFRAAIYSGLKISSRRNHAYPVQYYNPQGMDATIYIPWPDLKFINNTGRHILIQSKIEGTELYFQFYGTDDGRKVEVDGPHILVRNPDGSMKTTFNQKVFDKNGSVIIDENFPSSYDSPSKYPHPGDEQVLTKKPKEWSDNEWKRYKKDHGL